MHQLVHQVAQTTKEASMNARGTVKAAVMQGEDGLHGLVACSIYDTKPFYVLSMICKKIEWVKLEHDVSTPATGKSEKLLFLRLNINNDYNTNMNSVDVADQLRNHYRFDHWMRKRK